MLLLLLARSSVRYGYHCWFQLARDVVEIDKLHSTRSRGVQGTPLTCFLRSGVSTNDTTARLGASAPSPLRNPPGTDERSLAVWFASSFPASSPGSHLSRVGHISQCQQPRQQKQQQQQQQQEQQSALDAHTYRSVPSFQAHAHARAL